MTEKEYRQIALDHGCKLDDNDSCIDAAYWISVNNNFEIVSSYIKGYVTAWFNVYELRGELHSYIKNEHHFRSANKFNEAFDKFVDDIKKLIKRRRKKLIEEL